MLLGGGVAEGEAGDEGGDETVAPHQLGASVGEERQAEGREVLEGVAHPAVLGSPAHQLGSQPADKDAGERAEGDLEGSEAQPVGGTAFAGHRRGASREEDQHQRQGDAVVQAALDVECLADPHRHPGGAHHRLAAGGVGGGEDGGEQRRFPEGEGGEERGGGERSEEDGERHPHHQQAHRQVVLPLQELQVDAARRR